MEMKGLRIQVSPNEYFTRSRESANFLCAKFTTTPKLPITGEIHFLAEVTSRAV
jgi:hypothetical protein